MSVLVRLQQTIIDGLASEADAAAALAALARQNNFVGGRVHGPGSTPFQATRDASAAASWCVQAFLSATRGTVAAGAQEMRISGHAFRLCGLDAGMTGITWADDLARHVTATGAWTSTEADLEDDLAKLPSGARHHVRSELAAKGITAPTEAQIDLCLEAAGQRWAERRLAALRYAREMRCKAAADFPDPPFRTPERVALENAAWDAKHEDFKSVDAGGTRRMLYLDPRSGHTESWPLACIPADELERCAGVKAPPCPVRLEDLDLWTPHGELPTLVMRGQADGEVARASVVAPADRGRFRADVELVKAVTAAATMEELRAFILVNRRVPAANTATHRVTHDDLAVHAYCIVMEAWWPEKVVHALREEAS
jgi:hypothetical protein